eukprot:351182-Chlamydomonas_euryale.AAC.8
MTCVPLKAFWAPRLSPTGYQSVPCSFEGALRPRTLARHTCRDAFCVCAAAFADGLPMHAARLRDRRAA